MGPEGDSGHGALIITTMPSTVDVFLREQIHALREAGFRVRVVSSPDTRLGTLRDPSIEVVPLPIPRQIRPLRLIRSLWGLYRLLRRERPSIIHTHTPIAAFIGQLAACLARVPVRITTVHGLYFVNEPRAILRLAYKDLELISCRLATHIISVSAEDREHLVARHRFAPEKITAMHVGVNLEQFSREVVGAQRPRRLRDELGIPPDAVVFGTVARMVKEKGLVELLQAFAALAKNHAQVYLLHVGPADPSRKDAVKAQLAAELGVESRCRFVGHQYEIAPYLAAMDVFCLPTHREGYPVSVMEAAAMGLPSIVTDIRGCREAVVHEQTGLVVPLRDALALQKAMERLLRDADLRRKMGQAAAARARDHFDRRDVVRQTVELYTHSLAAARR